MSSSLYSVVLKWCPVLQKHLMRRYDKKNEDMRKTLILSNVINLKAEDIYSEMD